jgi:hypothetical protein
MHHVYFWIWAWKRRRGVEQYQLWVDKFWHRRFYILTADKERRITIHHGFLFYSGRGEDVLVGIAIKM